MLLLPGRILLENLTDTLSQPLRILLRFRADRVGRHTLKDKPLFTRVRHTHHERARPDGLCCGSRECATPAPTTTARTSPAPTAPPPPWSRGISKGGVLRLRTDVHGVTDQKVSACFDTRELL